MVAVRDFRRWLRSKHIGVLYGGPSSERAISLKTGAAVLRSLKRQGFRASGIDVGRTLAQELVRRKVDVAFIALHGPGGEDGTVQGLLEMLRLPYTGSGVLASALAMDKIMSKRLFQAAGLATARWSVVRNPIPVTIARQLQRMRLPAVVKPPRQGSALGVSIVRRSNEWKPALKKAFQFDQEVLVEEFIEGPEITVGLLGQQTLPIIEIVPTDRAFYDFHAKYAPGGSRHLLPARISPKAAERANALTRAACQLLGTRAVARVDLIVGPNDRPYLLEVNTIPGMTETSLLPDAAASAGIAFDELVLKIAEHSFAA